MDPMDKSSMILENNLKSLIKMENKLFKFLYKKSLSLIKELSNLPKDIVILIKLEILSSFKESKA